MRTIDELTLSKDLISFPSITPVDAGAINFLAKKLRSLGFKCQILEFKKGKGKPIKNLYAKYGNKQPNLCYAGHTDVVPPGNYKDWTVNPFKPKVKKGYLIGRGANDMKSSIACFISAVSNYLTKNKNVNGSISLLITGDEEGYATNGTKKVVDYLRKKGEKINFCIVGEPTNPKKLGEMIKIGRRGSLTAELEIIGTQGHIAYPHLSNNPINTIIKICYELKRKKLDKGNKNFQPSNLEFTGIIVFEGTKQYCGFEYSNEEIVDMMIKEYPDQLSKKWDKEKKVWINEESEEFFDENVYLYIGEKIKYSYIEKLNI